MAGRTERCSGCGLQLAVPPNARGSVQCGFCWSVTPVRSPSRFDAVEKLHERVRWARNWVKRLATPVNGPLASSAAGGASQTGGYEGLRPPLRHQSVHGNKRALLVGILYKGCSYELEGSVNDVYCMKYLLQNRFGFPEQCILILTEDQNDPSRMPTRKNMAAAMRWLVAGCRPGDSLVFHFSGHGSQQSDSNWDEVDGFDETFCPLDYQVNGMITDDEVHDTLVRPLPPRVTLHAVVDACHSGTSLDLPYNCKMKSNGFWQWEEASLVKKGTSGGLAICFSSCDDNQTSSDTSAFTRDTMTGAMTYCFIQAVESGPEITYGDLLYGMRIAIRNASTGISIAGQIATMLRKVFRTGLTQVPQLSSSEKFNIYERKFTL